MSLRIGSGISSFYDSSSRIERARQAQEIEAQKSRQEQLSTSSESTSQNYQQGGNPIQRTQVSAESSYQKTMLTDPSYAMDRMAGKLMDKLPRIFADMQSVPEIGTQTGVASSPSATPSKVVIAEGSVADHAAAAQQLQDISLGL